MKKQKLAQVLQVFSDFSIMERRIFLYLSSHNVFIGGYSDLCRALNLDVNKQVSNLRRSCLSLHKKGLIYFDKNCIFLIPDWDHVLLSMTH